MTPPLIDLSGKRGLVVGIANEHSIAAGCARAFRQAGARIGASYLDDRALRFVQPVTDALGAEWIAPCDVRQPGQLEALFERVKTEWGGLDFLLHSIAFAPRDDLHGRVVDTSADGFALAMDVSTHSFLRLARKAEPLLEKAGGGSLITMTYLGSEKVIANYGVMGLCKAALEAATRYMAFELGPKNIRVNAISPGPLMTRAASGIAGFDGLMAAAVDRSPLHRLVTPEDIGALTAFLVSDAGRNMSGGVHFVDAGYNIIG